LQEELERLKALKYRLEEDYIANINGLKEQLTQLKKKGEDLKKKEQLLNEEFRTLRSN